MYFLKYILLFGTLASTYGKPTISKLNKDYSYSTNTKNYYKFHEKPAEWQDAVETCRSEGAQLFYPVDEGEAREVHTLLRPWSRVKYVLWIGVSDLRPTGFYETVDWRALNEVNNKWEVKYDQTNTYAEGYNCVCMLWGTYSLILDECNIKKAFICKYIPGSNGQIHVDYTTITTPGQEEITEVPTEAIEITTPVNVDSTHSGCSTAPIDDRYLSELAKEMMNDQPRSHVHFGNFVGEVLKMFTHREKLEIMVSILEVIKSYEARAQFQ